MKFLAHLTNEDGEIKGQSLKEHCFHTAEYARESIGRTPFKNMAFLAGVLHDAGKAKQEYQSYLEASFRGEDVIRGSVIHTFSGVIYLFEKYHTDKSSKWEKLACEIIGYAIGSHHGLFDCVDMNGKNGFAYRLNKDRSEICYEESIDNFLSEVIDEKQLDVYFSNAVKEVEAAFEKMIKVYQKNKKEVSFQISMLTRLLTSSVIYGDRRDTAEFMDAGNIGFEHRFNWKEQREYFEAKIAGLNADSKINRIRMDISNQCVESAGRSNGIYRLNVPTGAGKTLSSLRYALAHAERYGKKRIIFIIPLLSVLDQNVKVIKEYLKGPDEVLEHHSNYMRTKENEEEIDHFELLADNWHAPIIVSTLVQLLEILFSHQKSAVCRMQSLCDSVIVIDEVQSLPKKVTVMFNLAMNFLNQFCNATIVMSSATQPCFEELKWPLHLSSRPDLVKLSDEQMKVFDRAKIEDMTTPEGMSMNECGGFCSGLMDRHASLLVICNTKEEARVLAKMLADQAELNGWELYHLSTAMCQMHRMDVLKNLTEGLKQIQEEAAFGCREHRLICISTQLIEAGMDVSFEGVVRVLAGIDNLAQAVGRCNRNSEYGKFGTVYLVKLKNENLNMLKEIKCAQDSTKKVLEYIRENPGESCIGEYATRNFYKCMFRETEKDIMYRTKIDGISVSLAELLSAVSTCGNEKYKLHQPFKTVGRAFHVFDQDTVDVLVPYKHGKNIIEELSEIEKKPFEIEKYKKITSHAKRYSVSLFRRQKELLEDAGLLYPVLDGRVTVLKDEAYDSICYGVVFLKEQAVENYIV